jgi:hypothetical protein
MACSSLSPASMVAVVQAAPSLQPNSSEFSTPTITASFPCAAIERTCAGVVAMRNQPLPAPPLWASM